VSGPSSISSSSDVLEAYAPAGVRSWPAVPVQVRALAQRLRAFGLRLPAGALWACVLIGLVHLLVAKWIVPYPVAREALRDKIVALTEGGRPALLIAGDSRAERHVIPDVVAAKVGTAPAAVANIAASACESSAVLAAYREFTNRFAPAPVMVISISLFSVNDRANSYPSLNNEVLWSLGLTDRVRLGGIREAVQATFLPERELYRRLLGRALHEHVTAVPGRGYLEVSASSCLDTSTGIAANALAYIDRVWFNSAVVDGVRWRLLQTDLQTLLDLGVQVVVLDVPEHPALARAFAGTPLAEPHAQFHGNLVTLCRQMGVPLLRYPTDWYGAQNPDLLYYDPMHLNRRGAELLSERIGVDLAALLHDGTLRLPAEGAALGR
jgi:hypothetical protein